MNDDWLLNLGAPKERGKTMSAEQEEQIKRLSELRDSAHAMAEERRKEIADLKALLQANQNLTTILHLQCEQTLKAAVGEAESYKSRYEDSLIAFDRLQASKHEVENRLLNDLKIAQEIFEELKAEFDVLKLQLTQLSYDTGPA